jgi:Na+-driven multidrug efflux pump
MRCFFPPRRLIVMHQTSHLDQRMNIVTVVWPIFVEQLLRMSIMTIDVLMLSQYSDDAVAAVGLTGNFILFVIFMHMIVSTGAAILIGQHLGAQQAEQGQAYAEAGLALSFLM